MNEPIENEVVESKNHLQSPPQLSLEVEQRRGFHLFYIFPILYVLSAYLLLLVLAFQLTSFLFYVICLPAVFGIINIIVSIVFCKPENRSMMFNALVLVKYAMIPFFIFSGLLMTLYSLLSLVVVAFAPFAIWLGPIFIVIVIFCGWLILVLEAPYAISYLRLSAKAGACRKSLTVLFGILQFFFTIDVIAVMVLTFKEQKWKKLTVGILILMTIFIMLILLLLIIRLFRGVGF